VSREQHLGKMIESIINEWLADYAELSSTELTTFSSTLSQDDEIVQALYLLLEERSKYNQVLLFKETIIPLHAISHY
jgi:hypothetical protein